MFELKGKVALVTGAASGIGLALVKELLRNELKGVAMVDIIKRDALEEIHSMFGKDRAIFINADVSQKSMLEGAFETTVRFFKQLDIVINNAGIVNELQWEKCIAVNLVGVISGSILASEKYLPRYKSGPEAIILNTASQLGLSPITEMPTYVATKSGIIGYTRALGDDQRYQVTKIRVVALCPGLTNTALPKTTTQQLAEPYLSQLAKTVEKYPMQEPEELAKCAMDLLKSAPSGTVWLVEDKKCSKVEFPDH